MKILSLVAKSSRTALALGSSKKLGFSLAYAYLCGNREDIVHSL